MKTLNEFRKKKKKLNEDGENDFERKKVINDNFNSIYGIRAFLSSICHTHRHTQTNRTAQNSVRQFIDSIAFNQFIIIRSRLHSQPIAKTVPN